MIKKNTKRTEKIVLEMLNKIGSPKDSIFHRISRIKPSEIIPKGKKI